MSTKALEILVRNLTSSWHVMHNHLHWQHFTISLFHWDQSCTELARMESMGVLSRVHKLTLWCAHTTVVPKSLEKLESVSISSRWKTVPFVSKVHSQLKVDETLDQLSEAKVFTKFDANSVFRRSHSPNGHISLPRLPSQWADFGLGNHDLESQVRSVNHVWVIEPNNGPTYPVS